MKNSPAKKKGIIRWGAAAPFTIVVALLLVYFIFFFDMHLKWLLSTGATYANGAKVDIGYLKTSFLKGDFAMGEIQVTDRNEPMKNLFEIKNVHFQFLLGEAFKKKLVIQDSSVEGISYGTARKTSGAIPPRPAPTGESFSAKVTKSFNAALEKKIGKAPLSNLDSLFSADMNAKVGQIKGLGQNSNAMKKAEEVEKQIDSTTQNWKNLTKDLPSDDTMKNLKGKVDAIAGQKPQNPQAALQAIQQLSAIQAEINQTTEKVNNASTRLTKEAESATKSMASIDEAIAKDIAEAKGQLKIPDLNMADLTPHLLGPKMQGYFTQAVYWADLARKHMPPKSKEKTPVVKEERKQGVDFHFGRERSYPQLLLVHSGISSALSTDKNFGTVKGTIEGVTNNPPLWGKPAVAQLNADFPANAISGAHAGITIDHTTEVPVESAKMSVASFPVQEWTIASGEPFDLAIKKATGTGQMDLVFKENYVKASILANLKQIDYAAGATNEKLSQIIKRAVASLTTVQIRGKVEGPIDDLKVELTSDLGEKIVSAIRAEFKAQLDAVEKQIRAGITEQVEAKKKLVTAKLEKAKSDALGPINSKLKSTQDLTKSVEDQKRRIENEKNQAIQQKIGEPAKKLKLPGF